MKNVWYINIELHKGGSTNVQSYTPTEQEVRLQKASADYAEYVAPNARWLNDTAANVLRDSIGTVQVDFNGMNNSAQQQVANAQNGIQGLTTGQLPGQFQTNMENSIRSGVENTMGTAVNSLAQRGVLNSSVTNQAMNDIAKNASNTMAEQYQNNIAGLNGLYGQQAQLANAGITTGAAAQEAAQAPSLALWNASLGLNGAGTSALGAVAGQGTTTTTTSGGGNGWLGGLVGLGSSAITAFCFSGDTEIVMADGTGKAIADVEVGDKIISIGDKDVSDIAEVLEVKEPQTEKLYKVTCVNDREEASTVRASAQQPLMDTNKNWIVVANLKIGDKLMGVGYVDSIVEDGEELVYDLLVDGPSNYIADGFVAQGAFE